MDKSKFFFDLFKNYLIFTIEQEIKALEAQITVAKEAAKFIKALTLPNE